MPAGEPSWYRRTPRDVRKYPSMATAQRWLFRPIPMASKATTATSSGHQPGSDQAEKSSTRMPFVDIHVAIIVRAAQMPAAIQVSRMLRVAVFVSGSRLSVAPGTVVMPILFGFTSSPLKKPAPDPVHGRTGSMHVGMILGVVRG